MEMFYILTEMWTTWVHVFVRTYPVVHLMGENLCILLYANYSSIFKKMGVSLSLCCLKKISLKPLLTMGSLPTQLSTPAPCHLPHCLQGGHTHEHAQHHLQMLIEACVRGQGGS